MLARSFRLKKKEVKKLYQKGQTRKIDSLTLRYLANRANHFRVAIVIPKSVVAKAVDRNRLKRKTAEIITKKRLANFDISFIFKKNVLEKDLDQILSRIITEARIEK